jgi:hypothetical protein
LRLPELGVQDQSRNIEVAEYPVRSVAEVRRVAEDDIRTGRAQALTERGVALLW